MNALIALERLRLMRGRSVWIGLVLALLIAITGVASRYASGQLGALETSVDLGLSHLLAYLVPYLFCAGMLSEEVNGRTLNYLTSRPVPRSRILVAKWMVGSAASAGVLLAACLVLHVGGYLLAPGELFAALPSTLVTFVALALQAAAYAALALFYGALAPSAASALFAFHLLLAEAAMSLAPGPLRLLSLAHHSAELAGLPRHGVLSESVRSLPSWGHLTILIVITGSILAAACSTFSRSEYRESGLD